MSENAKKIVRICAGLLFVLPYGVSREVGEGTRLTKVKSLLWEVDFGKKADLPYLAVRCPHIIAALRKK